jgi:hypothetical protein
MSARSAAKDACSSASARDAMGGCALTVDADKITAASAAAQK